jgi:hypothetical protein
MSPSASMIQSESTFIRNMEWAEKRERSLDHKRMQIHSHVEKELTFQPKIQPLHIRNREDKLRVESP